jgi:sulfur carrier protein
MSLRNIDYFMTTTPITITVNGESHTCAPNLSLPELLKTLDFNPRLIAVEYNGEILHRQFWDSTIIQNDDRLEIVTIVGGGCYCHQQ